MGPCRGDLGPPGGGRSGRARGRRARLDAASGVVVLPGHRHARGPDLRPRRRRHRDRRRRPARRRRGPAHRALRVRPRPRDRAQRRRPASFGVQLALPDVAARAVHASTTAWSCPTTSRSTSAPTSGQRGPARLPRVGAGRRPAAARSTSPATAATRSTPARAPATSPSTPTARRRGCRCARRRARSARCCPPGRYDLDAESSVRATSACAASTPRADAPYSVQVLSALRRRRRWRAARDRARSSSTAGFARAGHAVAYLVVTLPVTLLALPAVAAADRSARRSAWPGSGCRCCSPRRRACRAARAARPARRQPLAGRAGPADPGPRARHRAARSGARSTCSRDRSLWRMATHLALRPVLVAALLVVALAPVFALALLLRARDRRARGRGRGRLRRAVGARRRRSGCVLLALALPAAALALADAGDALPRAVRDHARRC